MNFITKNSIAYCYYLEYLRHPAVGIPFRLMDFSFLRKLGIARQRPLFGAWNRAGPRLGNFGGRIEALKLALALPSFAQLPGSF
jgi:hypothetical protein